MTAGRPTKGTMWVSDGEQAFVVDIHSGEVIQEMDGVPTGEVNARGWPLVEYPPDARPHRLIIEGDFTVTKHADASVAQDALDGAALRRLRESLPVASHVEVKSWVDDWIVAVLRVIDGEPAASSRAATIAEAADACREELEAGSLTGSLTDPGPPAP